VRVLRTDSPRVRKALARLRNVPKAAEGKGFNVWLATGVVIADGESKIIVTQDCDVLSFRRENLTRLAFAAAHPKLRYRFCKMYYSRATDRLYGRVSRLFLTPLLQALVRVTGHQPLLDFLQSFRYPLAGECAIEVELARELPLAGGWGLELGMMCEVFRRAEPQQVAQVDGGSDYDHRHQPLGNGESGLFRMSKEVAHALLSQLVEDGLPVCAQFLDALAASFARESAEALRRSRHLALINGLGGNEDDAAAVALFERTLAETATEILGAHMPPELPAWSRVAAGNPRLLEELIDAVAHDNR
jgi:glucosyl-3-phosphoglycerate synthase